MCLQKTYKVGDYYNKNGKEGIVFWVHETGEHGKIVSLTQNVLAWTTRDQFASRIAVNAGCEIDGKANTYAVMSRPDSAEYPAFVWCRSMGEDWYLPALWEMEFLTLDQTVRDKVNRTLKERSATEISYYGLYYWTSTEHPQDEPYLAYCIDVAENCAKECRKDLIMNVRAIATF